MAYPTTVDTDQELPDFADGAPTYAMADHQNQVRRRLRYYLEPRVGDDVRGVGASRGWVAQQRPTPGPRVLVSAIGRAYVGARRFSKTLAAPYLVDQASIATLAAGQKRIDVLSYRPATDTFEWTVGTPTTGTPSAPAPLGSILPLAEVFHRVGSAMILDRDDSVNSYITDVRPNIGDSLNGSFALYGTLYPPSFSVDQHNYDPTGMADAETIYLEPIQTPGYAGRELTGIARGFAGRQITLFNKSAWPLIIKPESASSDPQNRFELPQDMVLIPDSGATFRYDVMAGVGTLGRWRGAFPRVGGAPQPILTLDYVLPADLVGTVIGAGGHVPFIANQHFWVDDPFSLYRVDLIMAATIAGASAGSRGAISILFNSGGAALRRLVSHFVVSTAGIDTGATGGSFWVPASTFPAGDNTIRVEASANNTGMTLNCRPTAQALFESFRLQLTEFKP